MVQWERKRILIVVKTYPVPASKGIEVSCTAGLTEDHEWVRLFPVPFRFLEEDRRFSKYQWIEVNVQRSHDSRPESYRIDPDSIEILGSVGTEKGTWRSRTALIEPARACCLCCLQSAQRQNGTPTLGVFRPHKLLGLEIEPEQDTHWTEAELGKLAQQPLWGGAPPNMLEKLQHRFSYRFECPHGTCPRGGHKLICTDWEYAQLYRVCQRDYGGDWEAKFRVRAEEELIQKCDTQFFVGTVHQFPESWIIVGVYRPPKGLQGVQGTLF